MLKQTNEKNEKGRNRVNPVPNTWRGVVNRYNQAPEEIKSYFEAIPDLIEGYVWEVSLAFMFTRVEKAMNRMLYCGVVKLHRANSTTASVMVNNHHKIGRASCRERVCQYV